MHNHRFFVRRFLADPALKWGGAVVLALFLLNLCSVTSALVWDDDTALHGHAAWHLLLAPYVIDPAAYWRPFGVFAMEAPLLLGASIWVDKALSPLLWSIGICGALQLSALAWPLSQVKTAQEQKARTLVFGLIALLMGSLALSVEAQFWLSSRFDVLLCALAPWVAVRIESRFFRETSTNEIHSGRPDSPSKRSSRWTLLGSTFEAIVWALALTGAKETGAVWCVVLGAWALWRAWASTTPEKKKSLLAFAIGLGMGLLIWWLARQGQLAHTANLAELVGRRGGLPWSTRAGLFAQGIWRSILSFVMPVADLSPLKAAWVGSSAQTGGAVGLVGLLVMGLSLGGVGVCVVQTLPRSKAMTASAGAWAALGAGWVLVLFHCALAAFAEQSNGALLADRYLAPSALLLTPGLILGLAWGTRRVPSIHSSRLAWSWIQKAIGLGFLVVLLAQVLAWAPARDAWKDSSHLWFRAQQMAPQVKLANINDAMALNAIGAHQQALTVATQWIAHNGGDQLENCKLHAAAMNALLSLGHNTQALDLARRVQSFAWCDGALSMSTASLLLQANQCQEALSLLDRAQKEGDGGAGSHQYWSFPNPQTRLQLLSRKAFAQARCGSLADANQTLDDMAKQDGTWSRGSILRQSLLTQARH